MQKVIRGLNLSVFLSIRKGQVWNHGLGRAAGLFLHVASPLVSPQSPVAGQLSRQAVPCSV